MTSCHNATVTPTVILNRDVGDIKSSYVSKTCTDKENTGISSVSPEKMTEQTDVVMEMLLNVTECLLQAESMESKMSDELSQVQSQLKATNEHLAKAKEEPAEVKNKNT